jgi:hypothetical protein
MPLAWSLCSGDIEDAPALGSLISFKVDVDKDDVYVTADEEEIKKGTRKQSPEKSKIQKTAKNVVIVGAGTGAGFVIEGLKQRGFTGDITVISKQVRFDRRFQVSEVIDMFLAISTVRSVGGVSIRSDRYRKLFHRTKLSKSLLTDTSKLLLHPKEFYEKDFGVNFILGEVS